MKYLLILKKYWIKFGNILSFINTRILLMIVYFLIFPFFAIPFQIFLFLKKQNKNTSFQKYDRNPDITEQF